MLHEDVSGFPCLARIEMEDIGPFISIWKHLITNLSVRFYTISFSLNKRSIRPLLDYENMTVNSHEPSVTQQDVVCPSSFGSSAWNIQLFQQSCMGPIECMASKMSGWGSWILHWVDMMMFGQRPMDMSCPSARKRKMWGNCYKLMLFQTSLTPLGLLKGRLSQSLAFCGQNSDHHAYNCWMWAVLQLF